MKTRHFFPSLLTVSMTAALCATAWLPQRASAQFFGGQAGGYSLSATLNSIYGTNVWTGTNVLLGNTAGTNFVLPPSTGATTAAIQVYNGANVFLQLQANGVTNGPAVDVTFVRSPDGQTWDTIPFCRLTATPSAAGVVGGASTNVNIGAAGWICPYGCTNAAAISNLVLKVGLKPGY